MNKILKFLAIILVFLVITSTNSFRLESSTFFPETYLDKETARRQAKKFVKTKKYNPNFGCYDITKISRGKYKFRGYFLR